MNTSPNNHRTPLRLAAAISRVTVADPRSNARQIEKLIERAAQNSVQAICFPELSLTGYTCADLFYQELLLDEAKQSLWQLVRNTAQLDIIAIVGLPLQVDNLLYNVAAVFERGRILGVVPKTHLSIDERRWFTDKLRSNKVEIGGEKLPFIAGYLFQSREMKFAVEIGDALPASSRALASADIVFSPSASVELATKNACLQQNILQQSARRGMGYVYASCGFGESTTDLVFAGNGYIAQNGVMLAKSERFSFNEQLIVADICPQPFIQNPPSKDLGINEKPLKKHPFIPAAKEINERCQEIFNIQVSGLATRLNNTGIKTVVLGISGGLDSTLALLVCVKVFDKLNIPRSGITGITMPGFGTTDRTYTNAVSLMKHLGVTTREIPIKDACLQHFKDIRHAEDLHNVVYENAQARERTQILMDVANQTGALVVGTGNLSELALGWATYNGDHISMYAVNAGVPKTLVRHLVSWAAKTENEARQTLLAVLETPISPELLPAENGKITQKTEDLVGPYELHDFFLYYMLRFGFRPAKVFLLAEKAFSEKYDSATIKHWLKVFYSRFFAQQFKRSCLPDAPKVGSVCLSPRGDWRMPSDACGTAWLREVEGGIGAGWSPMSLG